MYGLVFPGQGVQRKGMGAGLFEEFAELTAQADAVLGYSIEELCRTDPERRLRDTRYAQPAIFFVNALLGLRALAQRPEGYTHVAGHSLGEYNALVLAGVIDLPAGLRLVTQRAELMGTITGGGMAAVTGLPSARVEFELKAAGLSRVYVANRNSDTQLAIAGDRDELDIAVKTMKAAGATRVGVLPVSGPFHTPLMAPAGQAFTAVLRRYSFHNGHLPVVSSVTGELFDSEQAVELLSRQIAAPVEWVRVVRTLRSAGAHRVDEVNGTTLTSLIAAIKD